LLEKKNLDNFRLNGHDLLKIRSLHGVFEFNVQRFHNKITKEYKSYFDFTNQFQDGYISERLKEYSSWLATKTSYSNAEEILYRNTGHSLISDQKIEQIVISKAMDISQKEALLNIEHQIDLHEIKVQTNIEIYNKEEKEILLFEDGILVRGQKTHREIQKPNTEELERKKIWHQTDAFMLECDDGRYRYIIGGLESETKPEQSLINNVKRAITEEYNKKDVSLKIVSITNGAKSIRKDMLLIFGIMIIIILDWYHLRKKVKELMSMIACNKEEKQKHINYIRKHCWEGEVDKAILYLNTCVKTKNELKLKELIGYLEKHKSEIINYKKRKECGKPIGSGRMECGVNQIVGDRQKNKGMSWSKKGSKALAILKVQQLNNKWDELWHLKKVA